MTSTQRNDDRLAGFSESVSFDKVDWQAVPDQCGVYVVYDLGEIVYVGMAGRDGGGSLRKRLKDHSSGQVVNMFAQYLFLGRVQFTLAEPARNPRAAKEACHSYIAKRCSFRYKPMASASEARSVEDRLKRELKPALNASEPRIGGAQRDNESSEV